MPNSRRAAAVSLFLVACLGLGGCAARGSGNMAEGGGRPSGSLVLTDDERAQVSPGPYQPEAPSAYDAAALAGDVVPVSAGQAFSVFGSEPKRLGAVSGEVRSVWISYLEMANLLTGKTERQFTANIEAVFDNCAAFGLNTVIVHVRPFADALYKSSYYPWSYLCTGTEGLSPGFDPLAVMVEEAHERGLRIEAWLNPYRIRAADSTKGLSANNPARGWLEAGDSAVIAYNGVISYNPASPNAQALIVAGAREIVRNYGVDGIHIDDYFYPTTAAGAVDMGFDAASYQQYRNAGGTLPQADWRRQNVETLLRHLYAGIKAEDEDVLFGISPQSSVYNNYHAMFLDVAKVAANAGYCDYLCPQIYFGYHNSAQPYAATLSGWSDMVTAPGVRLYVGLGAYKVGAADTWAGTAGRDEWRQNTDLLGRMVQSARAEDGYGGFVLYRYDSLFNPVPAVAAHAGHEARNLKGIMG